MTHGKRAKAGSGSKHLASINFPAELLEYLDNLSEELDMNRSSLVVCILMDFQKSGKTIKLQVVDSGQSEPEDVPSESKLGPVIDKVLEQVPPKVDNSVLSDDMKKMFLLVEKNPGICRVDLQKKAKVSDAKYTRLMSNLRHRGLITNMGTRHLPEYYVV